jgi:hypothetical protein
MSRPNLQYIHMWKFPTFVVMLRVLAGVVSDIHCDVARSGVASTHEIVSDIHRTMVKGQERTGSQEPDGE